MKKVLITGFDPFNKETLNPSYEVLKYIDDEISGYKIIKREISTVYDGAVKEVLDYIQEYEPEIVINLGQAAGRSAISLERVAINIKSANIADNNGYLAFEEPINPFGQAAYFTRLPINEIKEALLEAEIPVEISNTAGTFVCNNVMYGVLEYLKTINSDIIAGFIHVPLIPSQAINKNKAPSMSLELIAEALSIAIETIISLQEEAL